MFNIWFWMSCLELLKLYHMSLSVKYMIIILLFYFLISVPVAHLLMAVGLKYKGNDFEGQKTKLIIAGSISWVVISLIIMNYYINDIVNIIKNFV